MTANVTASDLYDRFAPQASPADILAMPLSELTVQVHQLRIPAHTEPSPDLADLTDADIAQAIQDHAARQIPPAQYLYVIDFVGSDVPSYQTTPYIPEDAIVVADTHFSVVEATASQVEQWLTAYPYWKNAGHPSDGKWIGASGDVVYIANGEVVQDPLDVLRALGIANDDIAPEYYDDILETANRVF